MFCHIPEYIFRHVPKHMFRHVHKHLFRHVLKHMFAMFCYVPPWFRIYVPPCYETHVLSCSTMFRSTFSAIFRHFLPCAAMFQNTYSAMFCNVPEHMLCLVPPCSGTHFLPCFTMFRNTVLWSTHDFIWESGMPRYQEHEIWIIMKYEDQLQPKTMIMNSEAKLGNMMKYENQI